MRVLIVKMSALGDVLHTLPALTDAVKAIPNLEFDWICEEPFADIPRLHPNVNRVIPHGRLRWKKRRLAPSTLKEQFQYYSALRKQPYDAIIDAQGRIKSARVAWLARGPVYGLDRESATDRETRFFYETGFSASKKMNAVERVRLLFAKALNYELTGALDYGIDIAQLSPSYTEYQGAAVFFHGTTWASKHWPEHQWIALLKKAAAANMPVVLPWGNEQEKARADHLVAQASWGKVLPKMSIWELAGVCARATAAVGVDTGLMHMAAALNIPTVSIFGSTNVSLTGAMGGQVSNLQAQYDCSPCMHKQCPLLNQSISTPPCYDVLNADEVWRALIALQPRLVSSDK